LDQTAKETRELRELIERQLTFGKANWERLPEVETEIDNWDPGDAEVFILEWSIEGDRLHYLKEYYKRGAMLEEQTMRYEELKKLVSRNRPIIERLGPR
jgi:hypothetical protein